MAEQIIDVGTSPNSGTGDPLRTAFIKTDNNFDQIWAAGPVGSNVRIQGSTVSTLQVNQDLNLSPNGVGNVRLNNNTIPGANNTWFLGSTTNRWRGLFVGNITAGNVTTTGLNVPGDAYIGGNLTVVGDTIQIGNITTDTKTIQLANTATTDSAANGSGVTVGANDDIATLLYESGNNVWTTNIGLQVGGPVTGTSLAVSSATVYGDIAAVNGNFTGNIAANYFSGNGSQLTGIKANVIISNTAPAVGNGVVWWNSVDGRAYIKYNSQFIDLSPSLVPDPTTYVGNVVFDDMTIENVGNVLPGTSNTYSLGSAGFQWKDLYVSNNTIYINSVPVTLGAGNVLTVNGEALLSNDSNTSITTTGTIAAETLTSNTSVLIGTGAIGIDEDNFLVVETLVPGGLRPSNDDMYLLGNISHRWSEVHANVYYGDGSQLTNLPVATNSTPGVVALGNGFSLNGSNQVSTSSLYNTNISNPAQHYALQVDTNGVVILPDQSIINGSTLRAVAGSYAGLTTNDGENSWMWVDANGAYIATQYNESGNSHQWTFDNTGNLNVPQGGYIGAAGVKGDGTMLTGGAGNIASLTSFYANGFYSGCFTANPDGNVNITTYTGNGIAGQWTFDNTGTTTFPTGGLISNYPGIPGANDSWFVTPGNGTGGISSQDGQQYIQVNNDLFVEIGAGYGTANAFVWQFGLDGTFAASGNISTNGNISGAYILGNGSQLTGLPATYGNANVANYLPTFSGNISAGNVNTTGNVIAGNILVVGSISPSSVVASPAPSLSGFSSVSAIAVTATGNVTGGNLITTGSGGAITMTGGNITGAGNISAGNISATGNVTAGNISAGSGTITGGNINGANFNGNVAFGTGFIGGSGNITGGNISAIGNISAGNISATGNVTAANFFGNGATLSNVATQVTGSWTVPVGNSTQSFTVSPSNTYYMWVDCNIPNGIIVWNATATVTNTNVPVVGAQYAWVYTGGGTLIDFTSIPNQFVGTSNTIVRSSVAPSATTNRFDFGINNASGGNVTVRYGYIKIS